MLANRKKMLYRVFPSSSAVRTVWSKKIKIFINLCVFDVANEKFIENLFRPKNNFPKTSTFLKLDNIIQEVSQDVTKCTHVSITRFKYPVALNLVILTFFPV